MLACQPQVGHPTSGWPPNLRLASQPQVGLPTSEGVGGQAPKCKEKKEDGPIVFLGRRGQWQWSKDLLSFFFLIPVQGAKTLEIRVDKEADCLMDTVLLEVQRHFMEKQGITLDNPVLTYKGEQVDMTRSLF